MGKCVAVTGGNRGIGLAIASLMQQQGDNVAVTYRSNSPPDGFYGVACDVRDRASLEAAFRKIENRNGPIEVLVANAGSINDSIAIGMSDDQFTDVLATNLTGAFRAAQLVASSMATARSGRIIFLSSTSGVTGAPGQVNYAASKSGLIGLTRSLAHELGPRGVTVNAVVPGLIETDMISGISDRRRKTLLNRTPLGRVGRPNEVASAVAFLASDEASYITGALLPVSGGLGMGF